MFDALTYNEMLKNIAKNSKRYEIENDTIAILFTRPDLETGRNILSSLEYYHFRTGKSINFYLPGYGAYWYDTYPDGRIVTEIDGVKWYFSNEMFVNFIEEIEQYSKFTYMGESELLLASYCNGQISYKNVLIFHLDRMIKDNAISSISEFFERLFRLCRNNETPHEISNALGWNKIKQVTSESILEKIPMGLGEVLLQEKYFCVQDMER